VCGSTLYDPATSDPIMDFNGSGSLETRYLWGPTGIVARQTAGRTVSWYLADALGSVRDVINNSGAVIDHVDFSAFEEAKNSRLGFVRFAQFAVQSRLSASGSPYWILDCSGRNPSGCERWTLAIPASSGVA
jgi:hypothetical protein